MKRVMLTTHTPLLAMAIALIIQGCGGSGGGNEASRAANPDAGSSALGAGQNSKPSEVAVHPLSGPAGSTIALTGRGFTDACGAAIFLDSIGGEALAEATITDGSFNVQAILPETAAAGDLVIVGDLLGSDGQACTQSTGTTFETSFAVTGGMPIITLALLEGRPGTEVEVQGRGFCGDPECSPVTIWIDGQVAASGIAAEADGTFVAGAFVPAIDAAGDVAVVATQTDSAGAELRGFGELIVTVRPNVDEQPPVQ